MTNPRRRTVLASLGALAATGAAGRSLATDGRTEVAGPPDPEGTTDWPAHRGNSARTGSTVDEAAPNGEYARVAWHNGTAYLDAVDEAIVADGTVFRPSLVWYAPFRGTITASDVETGERLWTHENPPHGETGPDNRGIGYIRQSPVVGDGRIYVSSTSSDDGHGGLHALDTETGELVWKRSASAAGRLAFVDGVLCTSDHGFDPETGDVLWTAPDEGVIGYSGGRRYGVTDGDVVTRTVHDGTVEETLTVEATPPFGTTAIANDTVYWRSDDVVALSLRDGTVRWRWSPTLDGDEEPVTALSTLAVADGTVVVTGNVPLEGDPYAEQFPEGRQSTVYALDATSGEVEWTYDTSTRLTGDPTIAGDTVYVGGHAFGKKTPDIADDAPHIVRRFPTIHALSTDDGTERWSFLLREEGHTTIRWAKTPIVTNGYVLAKTSEDRYEPDVGLTALEASDTATDAWNLPASANAPIARIETTPEDARYVTLDGGTTVTLDGSGSEGALETYEWKFGDGSSFDTTGPTTEVTLDFCGTLPVTLRVTGPDGERSTASISLSTVED